MHETFKYATKLDLSSDELTPERMLPLEKALKGRRVIQGYGCLKGSIKDDECIDEEKLKATEKYNEAVATMLLIEEPVEVLERLKDVVDNTFSSNGKVTYITKNSFKVKKGED